MKSPFAAASSHGPYSSSRFSSLRLASPTACSSAIASVTPTGYLPGPALMAASARWCVGSMTSRLASPLPNMKYENRWAPIDFAAAFIMASAPANGLCGMAEKIHFSSSGMFGSLNVAAPPMRSPRCLAARSQ